MIQADLNRAVARATGEDLREIRRRGFTLVDPAEVEFDPEPCSLPPQTVDWDDLQAQRNVTLYPARGRQVA